MEIIVLFVIIFIIVSTTVLLHKLRDNGESNVNQKLQNKSNIVNITVDTDGQSTTVSAASVLGSRQILEDMANKMRDKVNFHVLNDKSTAKSLKSDIYMIAQKYNYTARITLNSQFGRDKLPFIAVVSGNSMFPTLKDGQIIIALKTNSFKVGDIVIARHPDYGLIVKRLAAVSYGSVFLKSDNRIVETINKEKKLSDGTIGIETIEKAPLDTWISKNDLITVVMIY